MNKRLMGLLCVVVALVSACALMPDTKNLKVPVLYVEADRATYEAIAPVITALADTDPSNDPDLTGVNGLALLQALQTWEQRLQEAETPVNGGAP